MPENLQTALVITSISAPNQALKTYAEKCAEKEIDFILIGDKASPADFELETCDFWSLQRQERLPFSITKNLPQKHYARKNLGYLLAIQQGADCIIETDDDNLPYVDFWNERSVSAESLSYKGKGWINIYKHFSDTLIWPRGLPLEEILNENDFNIINKSELNCPIQQGLANENPDVDAVYRLTRELPLNFKNSENIALGNGQWCPFNSQNTTWFKEAFPLLYLPSYCSFRMTDIWRSFIAQRICWENNWHILFHKATVWQERNAHNLMKDFQDEIQGYNNNAKICKILEDLPLKKGKENIAENMISCYNTFIAEGLVSEKELPLLNNWLEDLKSIKN